MSALVTSLVICLILVGGASLQRWLSECYLDANAKDRPRLRVRPLACNDSNCTGKTPAGQ